MSKHLNNFFTKADDSIVKNQQQKKGTKMVPFFKYDYRF